MRDQNFSDRPETERAALLDRVWAATRPADLSAAEFDRIWREIDAPRSTSTLTLSSPGTASRVWRRRLAVGFVAAQAAAILIAAWVVIGPRVKDAGQPGDLVQKTPVANPSLKPHFLEVELDETRVVDLDVNGAARYRSLPVRGVGDSLAMNSDFDVLNSLESSAQ